MQSHLTLTYGRRNVPTAHPLSMYYDYLQGVLETRCARTHLEASKNRGLAMRNMSCCHFWLENICNTDWPITCPAPSKTNHSRKEDMRSCRFHRCSSWFLLPVGELLGFYRGQILVTAADQRSYSIVIMGSTHPLPFASSWAHSSPFVSAFGSYSQYHTYPSSTQLASYSCRFSKRSSSSSSHVSKSG